MGPSAHRRQAGVVALLVCCACTSQGGGDPGAAAPAGDPPSSATTPSQPPAEATPTTTSSPSTSSSTSAGPSTGPDPQPRFAMPVALAFDVHRAPLRIGRALASRVAAGDVRQWSQLGQPGGRLRVVRGPGAVERAATDPAVIAVVPAHRLTPMVQTATVDGRDPLRSPGGYPLTTPTDVPRPHVTTMSVVGDIMLGRGVEAASPDNPGAALEPLQGRLSRADLTIGNLESTLSEAGEPTQGDDSFAADPEVVGALEDAGFDLLSLANNHTGDYGDNALRETLRRLGASPIAAVGAGRDARAAWRPVVLEHAGVRFGFVAFNAIGETPRATADSPGAAEVRMQPRTGPLDRGDLRRMTRGIRRLAARTDVVLALPHWGDQYTNVPVPDQRVVARALVDSGADVVVGGHPHWVQGIQRHRGRLIAHSLGNFVFDMDFSVPTLEGVVLELVFWDGALRGSRFTPYAMDETFAPRVVTGPRADRILQRMWEASDPPFAS